MGGAKQQTHIHNFCSDVHTVISCGRDEDNTLLSFSEKLLHGYHLHERRSEATLFCDGDTSTVHARYSILGSKDALRAG